MCYPTVITVKGTSGTNKTYYHNKGDYWGWIELKQPDKSYKFFAKEIHQLGINDNLPSITVPNELNGIHMPLIGLESNNAKCGYYIQHLNMIKSVKPKMIGICAKMSIINGAKYEYNATEIGVEQATNMKENLVIESAIEDLKRIKSKLDEILKSVDELTLCYDTEQFKIYLIDLDCNINNTNLEKELVTLGLDYMICGFQAKKWEK